MGWLFFVSAGSVRTLTSLFLAKNNPGKIPGDIMHLTLKKLKDLVAGCVVRTS